MKKTIKIVAAVLLIVGIVLAARRNIRGFEQIVIRQRQETIRMSAVLAGMYLRMEFNRLEGLLRRMAERPHSPGAAGDPRSGFMRQDGQKVRDEELRPVIVGGGRTFYELDETGGVRSVFPYQKEPVGEDLSSVPDVRQAMESRRSASGLIIDDDGRALSAGFSWPVFFENRLAGLYRFEVPFSDLSARIRGFFPEGDLRRILFVTEQGRVLDFSGEEHIVTDRKAFSDLGLSAGDWQTAKETLAKAARGERGVGQVWFIYSSGETVRKELESAAYAPFQYGGIRGSLLVVSDYERVAGPVREYSRNNFLTVEFLLLLLLGGAHIASQIRKKQHELAYAAQTSDILKVSNARLEEEISERVKVEGDLRLANESLIRNKRALTNMLSDMKRAHEDLTKANLELHEAQEQILQSEKMAAVGQLSAGVAHEIKNPLAVILLSVESLKGTVDMTPKQEERFRMIRDAATRANRVVKQLLNFSRQSRIELRPCSLFGILENALQLTENRSKEKTISFEKKLTEQDIVIAADVILMEQVFVNLIANGIDAIDKKGKITLEIIPCEQEQRVKVLLTDTGEGIPGEDQKKIFEPFYTKKELGKGTGLGLSTVYMILEKHHASINVNSEVGRGTTFIVNLPVWIETSPEKGG